MIRIGRYAVHAIPSGDFALDGGSMFGVVPRPIWEKSNPPDERNRIALAMRLLLLRGPGRTWLVDTGVGDKWGDKENTIYRVENALLPDEALRRAGFDPGEITDVLLTHFHFDHGGGSTRRDGTPVFPNARHHVQRRQLEWARDPAPKDRASYRPPDFMPLYEQGLLVLHDGRDEIADGIEVLPMEGHTEAMQVVRVFDRETSLLYVADLVPTRSHIRLPFVMAYDNRPLQTMREKEELLSRAADEGWILFFEHDPGCAACRVVRGGRDFEPGPEVTFA